MGIVKSFFVGFFTVFFAKTLYYKHRDQTQLLKEIADNTRK